MGKGSNELKRCTQKITEHAERWERSVTEEAPNGDPGALLTFIQYFRENPIISWNKVGLTRLRDKMISAKEYFLERGIFIEKTKTGQNWKSISIPKKVESL